MDLVTRWFLKTLQASALDSKTWASLPPKSLTPKDRERGARSTCLIGWNSPLHRIYIPQGSAHSPLRPSAARYVAVRKGTFPFWQTACYIPVQTMAVFMLSMIFAFSLVAMATVVMTVFALSLVRGLLGIGQFPIPTGRGQTKRSMICCSPLDGVQLLCSDRRFKVDLFRAGNLASQFTQPAAVEQHRANEG